VCVLARLWALVGVVVKARTEVSLVGDWGNWEEETAAGKEWVALQEKMEEVDERRRRNRR